MTRLNNRRNPYLIHRFDHSINKVHRMEGGSFMDTLKSVYETGKNIYDKVAQASEIYASGPATVLKNILPNSDDNARPQFEGERHAILRLPNGRTGFGNYIGPGTRVAERIARGDPPRTEIDKVAQMHDIRYSLAKNTDDIRKADNLMLKKIEEVQRNKTDSLMNIYQAKAIYGKVLGEDLGLLKKGSFSSVDKPARRARTEEETKLLINKGNQLIQEGYGKKKLLPGDALKMKIIKNEIKQKMKKQKGKGMPDGNHGINISKDLGKQYQMGGDMVNTILNMVLPELFDKIGMTDMLPMAQIKKIITSAISNIKGNPSISNIVDTVGKTVLNIIHSQIGGAMKPRKLVNKTKLMKLLPKLKKGIKGSLSHHIKKGKGMCGKGMCGKRKKGGCYDCNMTGSGWWDDFYTGFSSVMKPGLQVLGGIADATGMPEFGIPMQIISGLM